MVNCGDQVLNGEQTSTTYKMKAWTRQSSGEFFGRPWVKASYRSWNGRQWLVGKVSTGGYLDHMWMDAVTRNGVPHLHVIIKHESLDSKPSAQSEHWFSRQVVPKLTVPLHGAQKVDAARVPAEKPPSGV